MKEVQMNNFSTDSHVALKPHFRTIALGKSINTSPTHTAVSGAEYRLRSRISNCSSNGAAQLARLAPASRSKEQTE